ncbi:hypothetical protein GCM10022221_33920 [Actinocorallia aurea]
MTKHRWTLALAALLLGTGCSLIPLPDGVTLEPVDIKVTGEYDFEVDEANVRCDPPYEGTTSYGATIWEDRQPYYTLSVAEKDGVLSVYMAVHRNDRPSEAGDFEGVSAQGLTFDATARRATVDADLVASTPKRERIHVVAEITCP